jgi:hypothetical protein
MNYHTTINGPALHDVSLTSEVRKVVMWKFFCDSKWLGKIMMQM